jgi:hypothetical protein
MLMRLSTVVLLAGAFVVSMTAANRWDEIDAAQMETVRNEKYEFSPSRDYSWVYFVLSQYIGALGIRGWGGSQVLGSKIRGRS